MTTQTDLDEAKRAYHKLVTGTKVVSVTIDGVQTQYNEASKSDLKSYIDSLSMSLGSAHGRIKPAGIY